MTSFLFKECLYYTRESHSKLYTCFLDIQKAFDRVWQNGLFYKLHEMGITVNTLKSVISIYDETQCSVLFHGYRSELFSVEIGTRQGGLSSPFFYLCYINGLLCELEKCNYGLNLGNIHLPCITSADDMVLLNLSKQGLDRMLDICHAYSRKWLFEYNSKKCSVIVFNESKREFAMTKRKWFIGSEQIDESEGYTHLGVFCDKYLSNSGCIKEAVLKLRGSFMKLFKSGLNEKSLHPFTSKKMYNTIVLPGGLFGCETWLSLSNKELIQLERCHRFCIKKIQGMGKYTRTDITLGMLKMIYMESVIDIRKLTLLGHLCRLRPQNKVKRFSYIAYVIL